MQLRQLWAGGVVIMLLTASCAHRATREGEAEGISPAEQVQLRQEGPTTTNDLSDSGADLNAIPLEVNKLVLEWVDYFQGRGREHMERYLSRSTRYLPLMKEVLRREGLPEDLVYIALIESGFSSHAHSTANAVGYWQFIRPTGRRYGLRVDAYVDERRDFVKSTEAAADYFKGLYNLFGSWYLAIASYNVGENRVKNVVMRYHTRDFWELARNRKLPQETIHYVPKFLAARLIAREPEKYGFTKVDYQTPVQYTEVQLEQAVDLRKLASLMDVDYEDLKDLNPAYKKGIVVAIDGKVKVRVPVGQNEKALSVASQAAVELSSYVAAKSDEDDYGYYRVRRGDTVSRLARKFRTSTRQIRSLNNMGARTRLVAGRRIKVPNSDSVVGMSERAPNNSKRSNSSKAAARAVASKADNRKIHIVKRGDTLIQIARQYNVSLTKLASHNQINRKSKISVGARLEIP